MDRRFLSSLVLDDSIRRAEMLSRFARFYPRSPLRIPHKVGVDSRLHHNHEIILKLAGIRKASIESDEPRENRFLPRVKI